jgi:hypothetical protein
MSIGLLGAFGPMLLAPLAIFLIRSSCARLCKCFVLKCGNLDKFESRSFDGILRRYTPYDRSYWVYNVETNTVIESCDVTFDETAPCPRGVFKCAGDKEMEESIFVDEGLQSVDGDEDEPLLPSTSSPEPVPASTLEAEAPQATTSSIAASVASRVEGEIISEPRAPVATSIDYVLAHMGFIGSHKLSSFNGC